MNLAISKNKNGTLLISTLAIQKLILKYFSEIKININRKNIKIDFIGDGWIINIALKVKSTDNLILIHEQLQNYLLENLHETIKIYPNNIHLIFAT